MTRTITMTAHVEEVVARGRGERQRMRAKLRLVNVVRAAIIDAIAPADQQSFYIYPDDGDVSALARACLEQRGVIVTIRVDR